MKYPLKHQDIYPGLVIGHNQIPFRPIQLVNTLNVPVFVSNQFLVLVINPNPVFSNGGQHTAAFSPPGFERNCRFGRR